MKSLIFLLVGIFAFHLSVVCQTKAQITNVDFHLDGNYIIVNYTITGALPKEHMSINLKFITDKNNLILPRTVIGDVGNNILGNGMKVIRWDIVADSVLISGNLKSIIAITSTKITYGGPSNAFLSIVVPGLGGYFVEKNKIRSISTTISTIGLLTFGIFQKHISDKYYSDYKKSIEPTEIESLYKKANDAHQRYYITTRIAGGIWAFDIIWTTIKGFQNKKEYKFYYRAFNGNGIRLIYVNNGLQLKYSVSF